MGFTSKSAGMLRNTILDRMYYTIIQSWHNDDPPPAYMTMSHGVHPEGHCDFFKVRVAERWDGNICKNNSKRKDIMKYHMSISYNSWI